MPDKLTTATAARRRATPRRGKGPSPSVRQTAELLKQVSDPTRLQVLMLLTDKERNVSELCADSARPASRRSATTWPCSATGV